MIANKKPYGKKKIPKLDLPRRSGNFFDYMSKVFDICSQKSPKVSSYRLEKTLRVKYPEIHKEVIRAVGDHVFERVGGMMVSGISSETPLNELYEQKYFVAIGDEDDCLIEGECKGFSNEKDFIQYVIDNPRLVPPCEGDKIIQVFKDKEPIDFEGTSKTVLCEMTLGGLKIDLRTRKPIKEGCPNNRFETIEFD